MRVRLPEPTSANATAPSVLCVVADDLSRTGDVSVQSAQQADTVDRTTADYNAPIHAAQVVTLDRQQHEAQAQSQLR